jgi:hypothetical protein
MILGCFISDFLREVENCPLLGYYAVSSDNFLPKFRGSTSGSIFRNQESKSFGFLTREGGNDRLHRNVHKKLPLLAS